jgi:hypothetical protein
MCPRERLWDQGSVRVGHVCKGKEDENLAMAVAGSGVPRAKERRGAGPAAQPSASGVTRWTTSTR